MKKLTLDRIPADLAAGGVFWRDHFGWVFNGLGLIMIQLVGKSSPIANYIIITCLPVIIYLANVVKTIISIMIR